MKNWLGHLIPHTIIYIITTHTAPDRPNWILRTAASGKIRGTCGGQAPRVSWRHVGANEKLTQRIIVTKTNTLKNPIYTQRCLAAKKEIYNLHGHGGITSVAMELGVSYPYLQHILAGRYSSEPLLRRVEAYIAKENNRPT